MINKFIKLIMLAILALSTGCSSNKAPVESKVGEGATIDDIDYTINRLEVTDKITSTIVSGYYTYFEPQNKDNTLIDLVLDLKNESSSEIMPYNLINASFIIGKEKYDATVITEAIDGTSLNVGNSILPKNTGIIHIYTEVNENSIVDDMQLEMNINKKSIKLNLNKNTLAPKKEKVSNGQIIEKDDYGEITIINSSFTKKLEPSNINSVYRYYEIKDPNDSYLAIKFNLKNNSSSDLDPEKVISCKAIVDSKYEYTGFLVTEDEDGADLSAYTNIKPLKESLAYCLIELPDEVKDLPIEVKIGLFGKSYYLTIHE